MIADDFVGGWKFLCILFLLTLLLLLRNLTVKHIRYWTHSFMTSEVTILMCCYCKKFHSYQVVCINVIPVNKNKNTR